MSVSFYFKYPRLTGTWAQLTGFLGLILIGEESVRYRNHLLVSGSTTSGTFDEEVSLLTTPHRSDHIGGGTPIQEIENEISLNTRNGPREVYSDS